MNFMYQTHINNKQLIASPAPSIPPLSYITFKQIQAYKFIYKYLCVFKISLFHLKNNKQFHVKYFSFIQISFGSKVTYIYFFH